MKKYTVTEQLDTRSGFGAGLLELGRTNPHVVGLCSDLIDSLKMGDFKKEFPEHFFQVGIASPYLNNYNVAPYTQTLISII